MVKRYKMKKRFSSLFFICFFLGTFLYISQILCFAATAANEYVQSFKQGRINWYTGMIYAEGKGYPLTERIEEKERTRNFAFRQAKISARQNLWDIINRIQIDKNLLAKDVLQKKDSLKIKAQGLVHNSLLLNRINLSDGGMQVTLGMNFRGKLSRELIPDSIWYQSTNNVLSTINKQVSLNNSQNSSVLLYNATDLLYQFSRKKYSGLIVDARRLQAVPAMICRIHDSIGKKLYGPGQVDPEIALNEGMAVYVRDVNLEHPSIPRVGDSPLVVQAIGTKSNGSSILQISQQAASKVRIVDLQSNILQKCKVAIVLRSKNKNNVIEYPLYD